MGHIAFACIFLHQILENQFNISVSTSPKHLIEKTRPGLPVKSRSNSDADGLERFSPE
jgi:hypothetical protein